MRELHERRRGRLQAIASFPEARMGDTSDREQTESGGELTEQIRGRVDAAKQMLRPSSY